MSFISEVTVINHLPKQWSAIWFSRLALLKFQTQNRTFNEDKDPDHQEGNIQIACSIAECIKVETGSFGKGF
jgi:hypothetical protein